jgi:cation-transporting ATPase E
VWIVLRNVFNLINLFILPLLAILLYFGIYKDVLVFSTFAIVNSAISIYDEVRIKRRLDKIKIDYARKAKVIREGVEIEITTDQLVTDDCVILGEGESLPTDGVLLYASYLQVDESLLTGESNYIAKDAGEHVLAGSFIVTGECVYKVTQVGSGNYINFLGAESKSFRKERSYLQIIGDKLTVFFVICSIIFGFIAYFSAVELGYKLPESLFPLLTTVSLIIPQTLIFLFTFTFSISVLKLSKLGALVQRGSAIESLANLDILCLDKTGTITTNEMHIVDVKYWGTDEQTVAGIFNYSVDELFGKNKTLLALAGYFSRYPSAVASELKQVPFTSKTKMTKLQVKTANGYQQMCFGALSSMQAYIKQYGVEVERFINAAEADGKRVIAGIIHTTKHALDLDQPFAADGIWVAVLNEDLNPGIEQTLNKFRELGVELKIISGDSLVSVQKVLSRVGLQDLPAIDLSKTEESIAEAATRYSVFTRSKPEDKLAIVRTLKSQNKIVGMVGDGVNDVLALKLANLSIAMSHGAKVARDISDVILLDNDFSLVPKILFEGENIIANLKYMNKLFLMKTIHAMIFVVFCTLSGLIVPLLPASLLVYSFFGTSLPSYVIAFMRRKVSAVRYFWADVLPFGVIGAVVSASASAYLYQQMLNQDSQIINTAIVYGAFVFSVFLVIEQLYSNNYLRNPLKLLLVAVALLIAGVVPSFVPLLNNYYDIVPLPIDIWQQIFVISAVAFVIYFILMNLYRQLAPLVSPSLKFK